MKINTERNVIKHRIIDCIFIAVCICAFFALWQRAKYAVEYTDEVYYVTLAYSMLKGNVPLIDIWNSQQMGSTLILPLMWIYNVINGNLDGIMLFLRHSYLIFAVICFIIVYILLRKCVGKEYKLFFCLIPAFTIPFSIMNFSYNTVSSDLLFVACALFISIVMNKNNKYQIHKACGLGIVCAFMIWTYPTMCFPAIVYLAGFIYLYRSDRKTMSRIIAGYIASGLAVALVTVIILTVCSNGSNLLISIKSIMGGPYFSIRNVYFEGKSFFKIAVWNVLKSILKTPYGIGLIVLCASGFILKKLNKPIIYTEILAVLYVVITLLNNSYGVFANGYVWFFVAVFGIVMMCLYTKGEQRIALLFGVVIPSLLGFITRVAVSNNSNFLGQCEMLAPIVLIFPFVFYSEKQEDKQILYDLCTAVLAALLVVTLTLNCFNYVYRDDKLSKLTERMDTTIYKGIYTTADRKQFFENLDEVLSNPDDNGKTALVMDRFTPVYIMSDTIPWTADLWSNTYTNYKLPVDLGYLKSYYAVHQNIYPDIIYSVDYVGGDYSEQDLQSEYNQFIQQNEYKEEWHKILYMNEKEYSFRKYTK